MKTILNFDEIEQLKIKKILQKNHMKIQLNDLILFEDKNIIKLVRNEKEYLFMNNIILNS
jgi:hypothetical protein